MYHKWGSMLQNLWNSLTRSAPERPFFELCERTNSEWSASGRGRRITVQRRPVFSKSMKIFTIGSCFALEIKSVLRELGYDVYPKYESIKIDPEKQAAGNLPERENMNHYNTYAIRQEFELALSGRQYGLEDFWHFHNKKRGWRDPYRKRVSGTDERSILDISTQIGDSIADGIRQADVIIITLGLTECWRNKANGLYICLGPKDRSDPTWDLVEFCPTGFAENYNNLSSDYSNWSELYTICFIKSCFYNIIE